MVMYGLSDAEFARRALTRTLELLRSLAGCMGILATGLLAGFLARGIGGGILVDGIAFAAPLALVVGAIFLAARALRTGRALNPDSDARAS